MPLLSLGEHWNGRGRKAARLAIGAFYREACTRPRDRAVGGNDADRRARRDRIRGIKRPAWFFGGNDADAVEALCRQIPGTFDRASDNLRKMVRYIRGLGP